MGKSLLYSIFLMKCPRCREGNMFEKPIFSFKKLFTMYDFCPHCGQKYSLEPGFYYGAMFVSYVLSAFSMFALFKKQALATVPKACTNINSQHKLKFCPFH